MPVQRIPRYRLLLQELFEHTPHSHPDYPCLKMALDEVSKRADEINERVMIVTVKATTTAV